MKRKIAVIGLGSFGVTVARELISLGCEVLGIDSDESVAKRYAEELTHVVIADASNEQNVEELGLEDYDAVVIAIGENLEASILATLMVKAAGPGAVWVKARNHNHHRIVERLGADRITHPEYESGLRVAQQLMHPDLVDFMNFGGGLYVVEVRAPRALCGRTLADAELGDGVRVIASRRGDQVVVDGEPDIERTVEAGDRFLLVGKLEALQALATN